MPRELITTSASRPGSSFLLIQTAKVRATATDSAASSTQKHLEVHEQHRYSGSRSAGFDEKGGVKLGAPYR